MKEKEIVFTVKINSFEHEYYIKKYILMYEPLAYLVSVKTDEIQITDNSYNK